MGAGDGRGDGWEGQLMRGKKVPQKKKKKKKKEEEEEENKVVVGPTLAHSASHAMIARADSNISVSALMVVRAA